MPASTLQANFTLKPALPADHWRLDFSMYQHDQEAFAAHERLKMALRLKGTSLAQIAREVGVSRTTMSLVGLRKISVPRVERAIAEVLEQPVDELFSPISREDEQ